MSEVVLDLKIICIICDFQIKSNNLEYEKAPTYDWLKCPKCDGIKFYLLRER